VNHRCRELLAVALCTVVVTTTAVGCGRDRGSAVTTARGSSPTSAAPGPAADRPRTALAGSPEERVDQEIDEGRLTPVASSGRDHPDWAVFVTVDQTDQRGRPLQCVIIRTTTPPPSDEASDGLPSLGGTGSGGGCGPPSEPSTVASSDAEGTVIVSIRPSGPATEPLAIRHSKPAPGRSAERRLEPAYRHVVQAEDEFWLAVVEVPAEAPGDQVDVEASPVHASASDEVASTPADAPPTTADELVGLPEERASDEAFAGRLRPVESSAPSDHRWSIFVTTDQRDDRGRRLRCIVVLQRTPPPPPQEATDGVPPLGGTAGGGQCAGLDEDQLTLGGAGTHAVIVSVRPQGPSDRPIRIRHSRPAPGGPRLEDLPASYRQVSQGGAPFWMAVVEPAAATADDEVSIATAS
jgi:hypothetical protein